MSAANNDMNLWKVEGKNKLTCGGELIRMTDYLFSNPFTNLN